MSLLDADELGKESMRTSWYQEHHHPRHYNLHIGQDNMGRWHFSAQHIAEGTSFIPVDDGGTYWSDVYSSNFSLVRQEVITWLKNLKV